ncbi:MAG TPA: DUF3775 domain-containing protein [Kiloniellales bacterium]
MLEISPEKVAHVIVKAREFDAKVGLWDEPSSAVNLDDDGDAILEDRASDATRSEVAEFIAALNEDEQASLVALVWVGRGTYSADELEEAIETARAERTNPTEDYLLGIPLLADFLEEGLEKLGYSIEDIEQDVL